MSASKISARIIADSIGPQGNRITTMVLTYPRIIHAEFMTHRMFSRNAASSRAIPASKMIKNIEEDPFIPVAWQKAHKGMQGIEYFTEEYDINIAKEHWLRAREYAITEARALTSLPATKQIANRLLEPFQWYTCIVTATEWENFFKLRCPQYEVFDNPTGDNVNAKIIQHRSRKDMIKECPDLYDLTDLEWLQINKGHAEIHISLLAEAMWDAMNESTPKELKAGEWHIPFGDNIDPLRFHNIEGFIHSNNNFFTETYRKIATARCARVSYLNYEGKDDYGADIKLFDRLLADRHMSPFEHCARAMTEYEYETSVNGRIHPDEVGRIAETSSNVFGWCRNFRGFIQMRENVEHGN
jgi:thymidylate synthase ThyX